MSKKAGGGAKGGRSTKSANVAFGMQKDAADAAPDVDVDSEGEEEDRTGWVEFTDPEAKRRVVELETVSDLLTRLHYNQEAGLVNVVGPTLGFLDTDFVISRDGEILGRASKVAPPPHQENVRVLEVREDLQGKIGQPDFAVVQYGITDLSGNVVAAELLGETLKGLRYPEKDHEDPALPHPHAGQQVIIGRVALRELSRVQTSRVLVFGGKSANRDELLRWFADVREFEYETELKRMKREIRVSKRALDAKAAQDAATVGGPSSKDGPPRSAVIPEDSPHAILESRRRDIQASFKLVATLTDEAREAVLGDLTRKLAYAVKRDEDINGRADAQSASGSSATRKTDDNEDEESDEHAAARDREALEHQVGRFRHEQGFYAPISKVIDPGLTLGEDWTTLRGKRAMQLLYNGVRARSQLTQLGSESDFFKHFASKVKTQLPGVDTANYVRAEVLLSMAGKGTGIRRPPGSLILINGPDISRNSAAAPGKTDIVDILRPRLAPVLDALMANMRSCDEDLSGRVEWGEFTKAVEMLQLDPPIPRGELAQLFVVIDADGGGSIEFTDMHDLFQDEADLEASPYDVEAAFELMAEIADVIIVLLDGKSSRFNLSELKIVQNMWAKHRRKMHIACGGNSALRETLGRAVSELLSDRALENLPVVSPRHADALPFITALINPQKQQTMSLLAGFRRNMDSILWRTAFLFAKCAGAEGDAASTVLMDAAALAFCNQTVVTACERTARKIPKSGGPLLQDLKAAARTAGRAAQDVLRRSRVRPLSFVEREEQRARDAGEEAAAHRAVVEEQVAAWSSFRHVRLWLQEIQASPETLECFRSARVDHLHKVVRIDAARLRRWGVPVGDRLRVSVGVKRIKQVVKERKAGFLTEGLYLLLPTEPPNNTPARVVFHRDALYDQGPGQPDKKGGLREGDEAIMEAATHGRVRVHVPKRGALEANGWVLETERRKGGHAYISAEDLAVMAGVLAGEVACAESSRELLQDGLQLLLSGDVPPQLLAEAVADLRLEVDESLGLPPSAGGGKDASDARGGGEVYARRWKLEASLRELEPPSSEDEEDGEEAGQEEKSWQERLPGVLEELFAHVAGAGGVIAGGEELEAALLKSRPLRTILSQAGADLSAGSVEALSQDMVLKREFIEGVVLLLDPEAVQTARKRPF